VEVKKPRKPKTPNELEVYRRDQCKALFLHYLNHFHGMIASACKATQITKTTYYDWRKLDDDFAEKCDDILDMVVDAIENTAYSMIVDEHNPALTIFWLKTKGRHRGYNEVREFEHSFEDLNKVRALLADQAAKKEY
jgi:hypothetical protein